MGKTFVLCDVRKKILIIEDDQSLADLVSMNLRRRGFQTFIAGNGKTGLARARADRPDGILLDLHMPEMGGFDFLEQAPLFDGLKDIPIIVLTASRQMRDVERAMALGAVGYVAKPVQVDALLERLEKHIPSPLFARRDSTAVSWFPAAASDPTILPGQRPKFT